MKNKKECPTCRVALTPESISTNLLAKECIGNEHVYCFTRLQALENGNIDIDETGVADTSGNKRKSSSSSSSSSSSRAIAPKRAKSDHCMWTGKLVDANQHFKECEYAGVLCGFGCGAIVTRKDITDHETSICPKRAVPCTNAGCMALMPEPMLADHRANVCPFEKVDCPFKSAGCHEHLLRRNSKHHESAVMSQHMLLILQGNQSLQEDNRLLRQEIQSLQQDNFLLQQQVADQDKKQQHEIVFKVKVGDLLRDGRVIKYTNFTMVGEYNARLFVEKGYEQNRVICGVFLDLTDGPFPCHVSCCIDIVNWIRKNRSGFLCRFAEVLHDQSMVGTPEFIPLREFLRELFVDTPSPYVNEDDHYVTFMANFRILPLE